MKKWSAWILTLIAILSLCSCKTNTPEAPTQTPTTTPVVPTVPSGTDPDQKKNLVYDMTNYQWFSDIFEEKPVTEWNAMGQYTIVLEGLHTPVVVNMDGASVLSISAFDQTVELGTDGTADDYHDGYSPVSSIRSTQDAVVIHVSFGEQGDGSILITNGRYFKYPGKDGGSIFLWVKDDGTLGYRQTWVYADDIEEEGYYALERLTGREQVLYKNGTAEIADGELVLTAEETVVFSDLFDPDAMFTEAKAAGMFTKYETLDELFQANKAKD